MKFFGGVLQVFLQNFLTELKFYSIPFFIFKLFLGSICVYGVKMVQFVLKLDKNW
jgi:hypothetical protein